MSRFRRARRSIGRLALAALLCGSVLGGPLAELAAADLAPTAAAELGTPAAEAACTPILHPDPGVAGLVPIQFVAQGNMFDHGPPKALLLVTTKADPVAQALRPEAAQAVAQVDLTSNVLVALFIGRWPQEGHRATIEAVQVTNAGVCLTAVVTRPGEGQDASDVETYPYHVVALPLDRLPQTPGTTWTVVGPDGALIASGRFP